MYRICYFCPDFSYPSGGTKCLYRHVFQLNRMGFKAVIVHQQKGFELTWHGYKVPVLWLEDNPFFEKNDILVFPEGLTGLMKQTKTFINKRVAIPLNWAFVYPNLPEGEDWKDYGIKNVITPSPVIKEFIEWSMNIHVTLIDDYIDTNRYGYFPEKKIDKIAYMARKSNAGDILRLIFKKKGEIFNRYIWARLVDLTEDEYANQLIESKIYLAINSQEGANISVLEAMSSGCIVVGFSGVGGNDHMIGYGDKQNCILVENENLLALGKAIEQVVYKLEADNKSYDMLIKNGIETVKNYQDLDKEAQSLKRYFKNL